MANKPHIISAKRTESPADKASLITVIMLSEKQGRGMKSCGPIPLLNVGAKSILEQQIEAISRSFSNYEIVLCAGFEGNKLASSVRSKFSNLNVRIVENQLHYNSNCCESARLCLNNTMNENIILIDGSILISHSDLQRITTKPGLTMYFQDEYFDGLDVGIIQNGGVVENLTLGLKSNFWNGVLSINGKKQVNNLLSVLSNPDFKTKFLFEGINHYNARYGGVFAEKSQQSYIKLDNIKNIKRNRLKNETCN